MVCVAPTPINTKVLTGLLVMVMHFLHARRKRTPLPGTEESLTTLDCSPALCCQIDAQLSGHPKHPDARLWPRGVGTLGLLQALTGGSHRVCSRWLPRDYRTLFPQLPERPRLVRLCVPIRDTHPW
jgi:hypothetical protein